jgi:AcrR family transcriptional regulator
MAVSQQREQRAEEILVAALECFSERGFTATSIEDIRVRSGASIGSIYHHFGSKEELAAVLYVEGLDDYQQGFLAALERSRHAQAAIGAIVRHHLWWVRSNPRLAQFIMNRRETELRAVTDERVRELNRHFVPRVSAWIEQQMRAGALRSLPLDLWEPVLLGPCHEFARLWLTGRTRIGLARAERELTRTIWAAVKGAET